MLSRFVSGTTHKHRHIYGSCLFIGHTQSSPDIDLVKLRPSPALYGTSGHALPELCKGTDDRCSTVFGAAVLNRLEGSRELRPAMDAVQGTLALRCREVSVDGMCITGLTSEGCTTMESCVVLRVGPTPSSLLEAAPHELELSCRPARGQTLSKATSSVFPQLRHSW